MKYKIIRIKWGTWVHLRHLIRGKKGETYNDYIKRVVRGLEEYEENTI